MRHEHFINSTDFMCAGDAQTYVQNIICMFEVLGEFLNLINKIWWDRGELCSFDTY